MKIKFEILMIYAPFEFEIFIIHFKLINSSEDNCNLLQKNTNLFLELGAY